MVRQRLTSPLIRDGENFREASWEEAMSVASKGFAEVRDQYGPDAFGMFSCSRATNEMNYAAQKFVRSVIGTNNIDSCNRT